MILRQTKSKVRHQQKAQGTHSGLHRLNVALVSATRHIKYNTVLKEFCETAKNKASKMGRLHVCHFDKFIYFY